MFSQEKLQKQQTCAINEMVEFPTLWNTKQTFSIWKDNFADYSLVTFIYGKKMNFVEGTVRISTLQALFQSKCKARYAY